MMIHKILGFVYIWSLCQKYLQPLAGRLRNLEPMSVLNECDLIYIVVAGNNEFRWIKLVVNLPRPTECTYLFPRKFQNLAFPRARIWNNKSILTWRPP